MLAVAGTHGKSTTTAILSTALRSLGEDPSYLVGADLDQPGSGAGDLLVVEADESDRSFQFLAPHVAVVTTIAHDHPENYTDLGEHVDAYSRFAAGLVAGGVLVANADGAAVGEMVTRVRHQRPDVQVITYGETATAAVRIQALERRDWSITARLLLPGEVPVVLRLHTPSLHHARNAVAALAVLVALGQDPVTAAEAVSTFLGVRRRFTPIGESSGVTVIDCYADHPNEITADLQAACSAAGDHRVIAVCQPSGFARVAAFGRDMGIALATGADHTVLLDVHGGTPQEGISSTIVADALVTAGGQVHRTHHSTAAQQVAGLVRPGDVVLLMGTGNVTNLAAPILTAVRDAKVSLLK